MIKNNTNTKSAEPALGLQKSILRTLAYYRAVKTPLTLVQVGRYMIGISNFQFPISNEIPKPNNQNYSLSEIKNVLDGLKEREIIAEQRGLYWLSSCNAKREMCNAKNNKPLLHPIVGTGARPVRAKEGTKTLLKYIRLEKIAQRKINIVRKSLKIFSKIPFLRAMFICGSVARKVSRPESDIDFLILTKQNRIWMVRFFLTVFSFLLGKKTRDATPRFANKDLRFRNQIKAKEKKYQNTKLSSYSRRDKFCLNHYRSSSKLKLEDNLQDLYSAQEYARMINVYSGNRIDRKFFKKNKRWMKKYLPNFNFTKLPLYETCNSQLITYNLFEKMLLGKIGNIIEKLLYYLQAKKIMLGRDAKFCVSTDNRRIVANENVIMFHLNPHSPIVLGKYKQIADNL